MTRPSVPPRALAALFASDADAAVVRVLRAADAALTASEVKQALRSGGVSRADADRCWPSIQRRITSHPHVVGASGHRYRWVAEPTLSAAEALALLSTGRPRAARRRELVEIVDKALANPPADREVAARQRQAEIDRVRALADLAGEVEELTVDEVEPDVMIRRVRASVQRHGLEPIERAGTKTSFDRKRHKPIGPGIRDAASVFVVRPGYVWKASAEDVLIGKAVVEE